MKEAYIVGSKIYPCILNAAVSTTLVFTAAFLAAQAER
jgi:hypothetical protein